MKRRRDAPRTRINRGVKKGRMILLKVERKVKKVRKSKRRMAGLFLKVEKVENLVVSRTKKLEDGPGREREISYLREVCQESMSRWKVLTKAEGTGG